MVGFYESERFDGVNRSCGRTGATCFCMGRPIILIKLFGHIDCHKTKIYQSYLKEKGIQFVFWMFTKTKRRLMNCDPFIRAES